jgi:hypothetical protein
MAVALAGLLAVALLALAVERRQVNGAQRRGPDVRPRQNRGRRAFGEDRVRQRWRVVLGLSHIEMDEV